MSKLSWSVLIIWVFYAAYIFSYYPSYSESLNLQIEGQCQMHEALLLKIDVNNQSLCLCQGTIKVVDEINEYYVNFYKGYKYQTHFPNFVSECDVEKEFCQEFENRFDRNFTHCLLDPTNYHNHKLCTNIYCKEENLHIPPSQRTIFTLFTSLIIVFYFIGFCYD